MQEYLKNDEVINRILDFSNCRYLGEVHELIQKELELPDWYGENLAALWDSLTGIMYTPADIKIIYHPTTKSAEELRESIVEIIEVFKEALIEFDQIYLTVDI